MWVVPTTGARRLVLYEVAALAPLDRRGSRAVSAPAARSPFIRIGTWKRWVHPVSQASSLQITIPVVGLLPALPPLRYGDAGSAISARVCASSVRVWAARVHAAGDGRRHGVRFRRLVPWSLARLAVDPGRLVGLFRRRRRDQQAGEDARQGADDADAREHHEHGEDPAQIGNRVVVAVADRRDGHDRPPQGSPPVMMFASGERDSNWSTSRLEVTSTSMASSRVMKVAYWLRLRTTSSISPFFRGRATSGRCGQSESRNRRRSPRQG